MPCWVLALVLALTLPSCASAVGRAAVSLRLERAKLTPRDAGVWIDEEFVGPLSLVAAQGVRLPVGKHRVSIQKAGYFPWDRIIEADREPIALPVSLDPIPD